jgi:outer membrane immunogenic protein
MKKLILAAAAVMVVAGSASAADLSRPVYKAEPVKRCAADWWRGGYIGVNGGGVNWSGNRLDRDEFTIDATGLVQKRWGGEVGGQIGYNWTTCNTLWGIEIDGNYVWAKQTTDFDSRLVGVVANVESRVDALITARTRAGIVLDSLLLYVTGGVAAVHSRTTWTSNFFGILPAGQADVFENKDWRWGFVAGFGSEWAWSDRVSIRSEVLYVETFDRDYSFASAFPAIRGPNPFKFTDSDSMWVSRIGLNVKFGDYPVAAKY